MRVAQTLPGHLLRPKGWWDWFEVVVAFVVVPPRRDLLVAVFLEPFSPSAAPLAVFDRICRICAGFSVVVVTHTAVLSFLRNPLGLVIAGSVEASYMPNFVVTVVALWIVIYTELLKATKARLFPKSAARARAAALKRTITDYSLAAQNLDTITRDYTALLTANPKQDRLLRRHVGSLSSAWIDLLDTEPSTLSQYAQRCQLVDNDRRTVKTLTTPERFTVAALESVLTALSAHFARAPGLYDTPELSFKCTVRELAGILIAYLLPLPCLQHLARPFRLRPFVPLFCTFYVVITYQRWPSLLRAPDFRLAPFGSTHPAHAFESALQLFVDEAQRLGIEASAASKLLSMQLKFLDANWEVDRAEPRAEQAVLDAVLEWKARKLELERVRRSKHD
ncbi:hypothetical protein JCM10207_007368 [Rhodosporidiobolus poonsookiae]